MECGLKILGHRSTESSFSVIGQYCWSSFVAFQSSAELSLVT